jgi:hypothetical protein
MSTEQAIAAARAAFGDAEAGALKRLELWMSHQRSVYTIRSAASMMILFVGIITLNVCAVLPWRPVKIFGGWAGASLFLYGVVREGWWTWRMVREAQRGLADSRRQLEAAMEASHDVLSKVRERDDPSQPTLFKMPEPGEGVNSPPG